MGNSPKLTRRLSGSLKGPGTLRESTEPMVIEDETGVVAVP
jgi:hypothetical protein